MLTTFLIEVNVNFCAITHFFPSIKSMDFTLPYLLCSPGQDFSRLTKNTTFLQAFPDIAQVELMVISHMSNKCFPLYYTL